MSTPDSTNATPESEVIEERAALWLAEAEEGLTPEQTREFETWCRADPRHAAAVDRLGQACRLLQKLPHVPSLRPTLVPFPPVAPNVSRSRRWFGGRLAAGVAAAAAIAFLLGFFRPAFQAGNSLDSLRYATEVGGYTRVALADGSLLELNENSEVRVELSARERRVTLARGEAHFSVTKDPIRPFVVSAHGVDVRAIGTAFNVRIASDDVEVLVTQGKVQVSPRDEAPAPAVEAGAADPGPPLLEAGQRIVLTRDLMAVRPQVETITPAAIRQALAWQERKLLFADTPLSEVVLQFNRRNYRQLIIGDSDLASRVVGGTFAADNVEAFVRLLEISGDIVAESRGDREIVLRKAP